MTTYTSEPGTKLGGRYRLEDRIAAGSGWAAWKAIDETLARPVTVFTFAAGYPRVSEVVTAARAASRLSDTRLAQVFDVEDAWDHAYIVLEWAAGDTLGDLLSGGPLEPNSGARIIAEAAAALSSAHAAGVAHLCLSPGSVRWSPTGEVKVVGLGIDAALTGATSDEPVLTDTRDLGILLYAALTGHWPGPDGPQLPQAPVVDGQPRSPRQVVAGIPTPLSDIACRAMQLSSREGEPPITSPAELSSSLMAVLPPAPIPSAPPPPVKRERPADGSDPYWPGRQLGEGGWADGYDNNVTDRPYSTEAAGYDWPSEGTADRQRRPADRGGHRANPGSAVASHSRRGQRTLPFAGATKFPLGIVAGVGILVVIAAVTATVTLWPSHNKSAANAAKNHPSTHPVALATLTPVGASGFDPLTSAKNDPDNENSPYAQFAIDSSAQTAWTTQWYKTANFGGLKAGSGLMLVMPKAETYRSVTVTFGTGPGTDVKLLVGDSAARSAANLASMTTVASRDNVSGTTTFRITSSATGRYLVIWFTQLPPKAGPGHWYMGSVFNVVVRGLS
jgi:serine/threonine protein kinase